ncbi:MAG: TonB family protein [Methylococcaceae bacterium]|nr:TonB family protein [Methylococcaceae bacterium]
MNEILAAKPIVSATDRLLVTVFLAVLVHALVIIGIHFEFEKQERIQKSLEIALVDEPTRAAPEGPDFLARENQMGRGAKQKVAKSQSPEVPSAGRSATEPQARVSVSNKKVSRVLPRETAESKMDLAGKEEDAENAVDHPELNAVGLHQQIAALSAEIALASDKRSRRPRIKFVNSVHAHKHKAAAYEKAFQIKVERIGILNYPNRARREHLSGSLLLAVGVRNDGTIYRIEVRRSSGHQALDDGAIRIARLAAPFAPFPSELAMDADVLVITRTWKFSDDTQLTTSR